MLKNRRLLHQADHLSLSCQTTSNKRGVDEKKRNEIFSDISDKTEVIKLKRFRVGANIA